MKTLPTETEELTEEQEKEQREQALERLDAFGQSLSKTRTEAIQGRQQSGIEQEWLEDEESYEGIDDANRSVAHTKPTSPDGGTLPRKLQSTRSTVFLNITRPYTDAAAAKVADMLLPTDDRNWALKPTPIPDLIQKKSDNTPMLDGNLQPMTKQVPGADGQMQQAPYTVADFAQKIIDEAVKRAKAAEKRIEDWLVESQFNSEIRKVIENTSKVGTGIIKGPYPSFKKKKAVIKEGGLTSIKIEEDISPESRCISHWNFYPDPSCGDNIHNGSYTWESDNITARNVRELADDPSYIAETIQLVLAEGPGKKFDISKNDGDRILDKDLFEIWYYHGFAKKEDMEAAGCKCDDMEVIPAMITMINDRVIKAVIQPLDSGEFPYDVMVWQKRADSWAGIGVARQVRTPQRMLNAATRNMMDNAALSAGVQLFLKKKGITPQNGNWTLEHNKIWLIEDDEIIDARTAIQSVVIDSRQGELMNIIQFAIKMAEDVTGLPMLLQGQSGTAPETLGGMQMLNNNASTVLRRVARTFDDCITEPHIRRYYEWLLIYGEEESEKGDFTIDARGSSALVERDIQNQTIAQNLQLSLNPAFGISPKRAYAEYLKSQRLDVKQYEYTEEELKQIAEQAKANPPQDPRIKAAEINNQTKIQLADMSTKETASEIAARQQEAREERAFKLQMAQLERDTEMVKLANSQKMSIDKIKAQLTQTAMTIKNERDLFGAEAEIKQRQGSGI